MRKNLICILMMFAMVSLISGCTQKVKIKLLKPGEVKISGVSKIAVLPFNSVQPNIRAGKYSANRRVCELARRSVADTLYTEPYFQLVDLDLEKSLTKLNRKAKPENRLDGILYGKVWWQISNEYKNFMPSKMSLSKWTVRKYVCGEDSDGKPVYCSKTLVTQRKDKFFKSHYRVVTATLMMSLSVYRLSSNGHVEKVAHVFEVAKKPAVIKNGAFSTEVEIIGFEEAKDRTATLKTEDGFTMTSFSNILGLTSVSEDKSALDNEVSKKVESIPAVLGMNNALVKAIANRLKSVVQPHSEDFEIVMQGKDKKTQTLFMTEAYRGLTKYLALKISNGDEDLAYNLIDDVDFDTVAKEVILRKLKAEHAQQQAELPAAERQPFVQPVPTELAEEASSYLDGLTSDIYNLALAFEGLGDFERALAMYRFDFNEYEDTDQDLADGIGRCSLALDLAVRVDEAVGAKEDAKNLTKLRK